MRATLTTAVLCATLLATGASGSETISDYMIQDVCVDDQDKPITAVSPLDPKCSRHRDLRPGERLPYHRHDWPSFADKAKRPFGYQRGDSVPYETKRLGTITVTTWDLGDGERQFGRYDGVKGDGGSFVAIASKYVGSMAAIDRRNGAQLFVNMESCKGQIGAESLQVGWPFFSVRFPGEQSGLSHSRLKVSKTLGACPTRYTHVHTEWSVMDFAPMIATGKAGERTVSTVVSSHYSGPDIDRSPNMERMYFSRELGRMRWERWQNLAIQERPNDRKRSARLAESGKCVPAAPAPKWRGEWVMVACREMTNIVPPDDRQQGTDIGTYIKSMYSGTVLEKLLDGDE